VECTPSSPLTAIPALQALSFSLSKLYLAFSNQFQSRLVVFNLPATPNSSLVESRRVTASSNATNSTVEDILEGTMREGRESTKADAVVEEDAALKNCTAL